MILVCRAVARDRPTPHLISPDNCQAFSMVEIENLISQKKTLCETVYDSQVAFFYISGIFSRPKGLLVLS
jgi:hypothetical protein